ncbi:MAG: DUF2520 domain-containing protein [Bacteroidota bacterium]
MERVAFVGAGKLAFHLAPALKSAGLQISQVYSRTEAAAQRLAQRVDAIPLTQLSELDLSVDLVIIAVADDAIGAVAASLGSLVDPVSSPLVVHTSGGTPTALLGAHFPRYGSFYPLQTFTFDFEPDFSTIPFCLYSPNVEDLKFLEGIASRLSDRIYELDDQQRQTLHVSAVFVNNFVNALYRGAYQLMEEDRIPLELLEPLMRVTLEKALEDHPQEVQTGPAVRGDQKTIDRHLARLEPNADLTNIYAILTDFIQNRK